MDWSRLPDPVRRKLESRLALLPPQYRETLEAKLSKLPTSQIEQALDRASPLIDRLLAATGKASAPPARSASGDPGNHAADRGGATTSGLRAAVREENARSHYNRTVQRGDPPLPALGVVVVLLLALLALAWHWGWLTP
jgi:hypothetical protein